MKTDSMTSHEDVVLALIEPGIHDALREGRAQAESFGSTLVICRVANRDAPIDLVVEATSELVTLHGDPSTAVIAEARTRNVRPIALDASAAHRMHATTAELVVRHAPCTVLVTRPAYGLRVVVATDLSTPSLPAIVAGVREARRRDVPITVLHCVENDAAIEAATTALGQILAKLECDAEIVVIRGPAIDSILRALDGVGADLLVIAAHGHHGVKAMLVGSTAESLVRSAPCSVLVVRP